MSEHKANEQGNEASSLTASGEGREKLNTDPTPQIVTIINSTIRMYPFEQPTQDQDKGGREDVASNPNTPWKSLESLVWEVPHEFLRNPIAQLQIAAHPEQIRTDATFWGALLRPAVIPSLWWNWLLNHPTLSRSQTIRLHVQYAAEPSSFSEMLQEEDEHTLLTLVELLSVTCAQGIPFPFLPGNPPAHHSVTICLQLIKERLQWLAQSQNEKVRTAVASNVYTPLEVIRNLAKDEKAEVRSAVAWNPQTPMEVLKLLARDTEAYVRATMISTEHVSEEILEILAQDAEAGTREDVARHPKTPAKALQSLAQDQDAMVRMWVASNPHTPVEALKLLAQDAEEYVRTHVVNTELTLMEPHEVLAQDQIARYAIASNPQASERVLLALAQDEMMRKESPGDSQMPPIEAVRNAIARNPQAPVEALRKLAQDHYANVRASVASNPQTPTEILLTLAADLDETVRKAVASNKQTLEELLRRLAQDHHASVRMSVAEHAQAPTEILSTLAADLDETVRKAVARNGRTPIEILSTLAHDANSQVRRSANIVQELLAEIEGPWCEQEWQESLCKLLIDLDLQENKVPHFSPECQLVWVLHLHRRRIPDHVLRIVLANLAASWDATKIKTAFVVDEATGVAASFPARRWPYRYIIASCMPPIALQKLATSPCWDIRFLVALHEQTPLETRQRLSLDGNRYVRTIAKAKAMQMATP